MGERLPSDIVLLHHNDADGLSSGAILRSAFYRAGVKVRGFCLEKPYPQALEQIFDEDLSTEAMVIFADFGSGMLSTVFKLNGSKRRVLLLDHHRIEPFSAANIEVVNPLNHGLRGDECSASSLAFLFAEALDARNQDFAAAGMLGALGDGFIDGAGELIGFNRRLFDAACRDGRASRAGDGRYLLADGTQALEIVSHLNALGSFGYFKGGPDVAMKGLLEGFDQRYVHSARTFQDGFDSKLAALLASRPVRELRRLSCFTLGPDFGDMGVKTVGLICEHLRDSGLVSAEDYILGFQAVPDQIPGLGPVKLNQVKISMRLGTSLSSEVKQGRAPDLLQILPPATQSVGGFVDACHPHAAATTIPKGSEQRFLSEVERIIKNLAIS